MRTFSEFLEEAKRIKVLRTAHYTDRENKKKIMDTGFRDSTSTGTYHPDDRKGIVYTTPSSRVGNDYGTKPVSLKIVNPKIHSTDSPKGYRSKLKSWRRDASDEDVVSNTNKPTDPRKQSKSAIESGNKIVRVPDAHENLFRKVPKGSYIMVDKEVANKSIDKNPQPTMRTSDKPKRTKTQPKKKMKTFSEFLEEALISSLIKAAARQFVKSKVLQKAIPKVKTIPMRSHWTNKAIASLPVPSNAPEKLDYQKLYHGTTKPASQAISKDGWKTDVNVSAQKRGSGVYATPDKKTAIGYAAGKVRQTGGTPDWNNIDIRRFNMPKNVYDDAMKRQVQNPDDWANISQVKQVTMKPSYANKIDITDKPNSAIDFTNSQRDEIKRRVAAGLKNKANQDEIKRELGINPIKEQKTFSQFIEEATKIISLKTFHHGSDEESVKSIKRKGPKPSPQGSEGPGHYVTPDREKAEKYAEFTSKQRNKKPAVVSYRVSTQSIQKTSNIPKGLTSKPKTSEEKPVVQNTRTGHVAMDADYANKRMIRNLQPKIITLDKPKRTKTQPKRK